MISGYFFRMREFNIECNTIVLIKNKNGCYAFPALCPFCQTSLEEGKQNKFSSHDINSLFNQKCIRQLKYEKNKQGFSSMNKWGLCKFAGEGGRDAWQKFQRTERGQKFQK